ncbi:SIMPL domain-containing protein [Agromyces laixinhei]|uniref:SIMPL domain-containing protein n=1 Tax=Agromyces laixinhei TaxID=2585717 RepID=UPI0018DB5561|nr:SIMPL domain-containing protein [Agromyces laixinhei]
MTTTITVRGTAEQRIAPELGAVALTVSGSGAERDATLARTSRAHDELLAAVRELEASGVLDTWSAGQLRVFSHRPWNNEGKQLPVVHQTSADVEVVFTDLGRLGDWVSTVSLGESIGIVGIDWRLTDATRKRTQATAQREAVADAVAKAAVYAAALGLGTPAPAELADTGLLTVQPVARGGPGGVLSAVRMSADISGGGGAPSQFTPALLVIEASVEARFTADPR